MHCTSISLRQNPDFSDQHEFLDNIYSSCSAIICIEPEIGHHYISYADVLALDCARQLTNWPLRDLGGSGIILCMRPANERRCCNVTSSLIGWVHIQNDPWRIS